MLPVYLELYDDQKSGDEIALYSWLLYQLSRLWSFDYLEECRGTPWESSNEIAFRLVIGFKYAVVGLYE